MLPLDGNGELTHAMGVELDLSDKPVGLGVRSLRASACLPPCLRPATPAFPRPRTPSAAAPAHALSACPPPWLPWLPWLCVLHSSMPPLFSV
ncbi:hypothetical protein ZWY2020_014611 [Hordeum vulgare]|nr:hypothetical protein ZWY2020_014611 [Hordeum vulgare]